MCKNDSDQSRQTSSEAFTKLIEILYNFILIAFPIRFFQKINQDLFKELKLTKGTDDVDMDSVNKYLDSAFIDKVSAENYKVSAQKCYEEINSNLMKIQLKYEASPFEVNRTDCNVKFMAMMTCVEFKTFLVIYNFLLLKICLVSLFKLFTTLIIPELSKRIRLGVS